jgi:glutaredoxin
MNRIALASLFALAATVGLAARFAVAADPPAATGAAGAGGFKNLKVLPKSISKAELKAIMKAQSKALGVDCDHCHEDPNMDSDAKPAKEIARQMMRMQAEINAKWLKGVKEAEKNPVTCATCHQGKEHPPKL